MPRRSINQPLVFTAVFLVLVALLMTGALPSPIVTAEVECNSEYPAVYPACQTQTAQSSGGGGGGGGGGNTQPAASTPTATTAVSATPALTSTLAPSQAASPTLGAPAATPTRAQATVEQPSPTPTLGLPAGVAPLVCVPGATVTLTGQAPPGTALLAYFDGRPVGGGFSRADGSFSIDLLIGDERPGLYIVDVRERESLNLVVEFGCEVPGGTPTPTFEAPA